ncbi:MAG TPA: 2-succinyl-5-enolpyruvyl-6-hydroxy-3-cyclohexene-1-carboxylic-acid synthase [Actinomycetes bacterium]|nr:2-succinyl-5-enolpyruvyl-6-hydroxy-3-cyclohexene-1-carboxylic-acid synthase [Actinomycetes bacterium]
MSTGGAPPRGPGRGSGPAREAGGGGDAGWRFARALVDEWARLGLTDAALAPGSRSAPLALALAEHPGVRVHVHLDERSASFFALGLARAAGRPAAVLCTSGTAAANLHPAVLEAFHGRVPLLVLTADRPPELRDSGANQTVDQTRLYGAAVRWSADLGPPRPGPGAAAVWRGLAARAWAQALGRPAGPVHLNLPFDEPLVPGSLDAPPPPGRPRGRPWTVTAGTGRPPTRRQAEAVAEAVAGARRGLVVAGWGADTAPGALAAFTAATGWPVLADPISDLRTEGSVSTYDALLRVTAFAAAHRPDLVLRLGGPPTGRALGAWLGADVPQVLVDPDGAWADPPRAAALRVPADPSPLLREVAELAGPPCPPGWPAAWAAAERAARRAIDELVDGWEEPFEGRAARDVAAALPDGATLLVGSSGPVRDLEAFARPRSGLRHLANRGVSGIDGFVATTLGVAAAASGPVAALMGDLTFLHDASTVLGAARRDGGAALVVLDNDGGGIFSSLPQAGLPRHFETLFGTPHDLDLGAVAEAAGLPWRRVAKAAELPAALGEALAAGGTRVLLVPGDRAANVRRHREVQQAVAAALGP